MSDILDDILNLKARFEALPDFLDHVFRKHKAEVLLGRPVVLFGAGQLASEFSMTLRRLRIQPVAFCDNNPSRAGQQLTGLPILTFDELQQRHANSLILIAASQHASAIENQLLSAGFNPENILCKPSDTPGVELRLLYLYAMNGAWSLLPTITANAHPLSIVEVLNKDRELICRAYQLLSDEKSRDLFVCKLALLASSEHFELYAHFINNFSEPVLESGLGDSFKTEEHYYFSNDAIKVEDGEVYIDVGAADGDTIQTFTEACQKRNVQPKQIIAFEPDPDNFAALLRNTADRDNIFCHRLGLWTHNDTLRFTSSSTASSSESAAIHPAGDICIDVVALDEFLSEQSQNVTLIKMDPPGNVVPQALRGAANTIRRCRPKLALGVYHSIQAIYEIPLLVNQLCPDYKLYLRHHARHTNETDLLAHV